MHLSKISLTALASFSLIFLQSSAMDLTYIDKQRALSLNDAADTEEKSAYLTTAEETLLLAAENGNDIGCCFLLEAGVPVDVKNAQGQTPLMLAARNSHIAVCKLLIQNGALIGATDEEGHSALSLAGTLETHNVLKELLLKEQPRKLSGAESPPD